MRLNFLNHPERSSQKQRVCLYLVLVIFIGILSQGCQHSRVNIQSATKPNPVELANQAFLNGDYALARDIFNALAQDNHHPEYAGSRIYGLTCVDMATAKNKETFLNALKTLSSGTGTEFANENPELLIKALTRGMNLMLVSEQKLADSIQTLKAKEKKREKTIRILRDQVKLLKGQISTLESIDQDFQEKRKKQ